jgi:hypothetical protein
MSTQTASRIVTETIAVIMDVFAGRTGVTREEIGAQIEQTYAITRKRAGFMSYANIYDGIERAGANCIYSGFNFTGTATYNFPAA